MNITKYLGIPFEFNRATFESCDCAGLVLLFLKHELNIDINTDISDIRTERAKHVAIEQHINSLLYNNLIRKQLAPETYSHVCLFFNKQNGLYTHCGLIIGGRALHAIEGRATALTPIAHVMDKELEIYEINHAK